MLAPALAAVLCAVPVAARASAPTTAGASASAPAANGERLPARLPVRSAAAFESAARQLPIALRAAISRDLGLSGAQYLADATASQDAVAAVARLRTAGVAVLGYSVRGTRVSVHVSNASDARAVTALGATAVLGAPAPARLAPHFVPAADLFGGTGTFWEIPNSGGQGYQCSVAFNGIRPSDKQRQFLTAGHCLTDTAVGTPIIGILQTHPGVDGDIEPHNQIGTTFAGAAKLGSGYDAGVVRVKSGTTVHSAISTWQGGTGDPQASFLTITGEGTAVVGAELCKSGSRTGWTCGTVKSVDRAVQISDGGTKTINSIIATTCILPGDSGGAAVIGTLAVGVDSTSSTGGNSCALKGYESGFFPLRSASKPSVASLFGSRWELSVAVSTPVVTSPASGSAVTSADTLRGTLAHASTGSTVSLYLNSAVSPVATVSASSGSWRLPLTHVPSGAHTYRVIAKWRTSSVSTVASGSLTMTSPSISGALKPGSTLTAHFDGYSGAATQFDYRWEADGSTIGTNASTLALTGVEYGQRISVRVTPLGEDPEESSLLGPVAAGTLHAVTATISGSLHVGQVLTAQAGSWPGIPVHGAYQWLRNGRAIAGATGQAYRAVPADRTTVVNVAITISTHGYTTIRGTTKLSTAIGSPLVTAGTPTIAGSPIVGRTLTAGSGVWGPSGVALHYRWYIAGRSVAGATSRTFVVPSSAIGKVIQVRITGTKKGYVSVAASSAPTAPASS
jgi:hypothetical protein